MRFSVAARGECGLRVSASDSVRRVSPCWGTSANRLPCKASFTNSQWPRNGFGASDAWSNCSVWFTRPAGRPPTSKKRLVAVCASKEWDGEKSPYQVLGLERDCTSEDVKTAYRSLAKTYHPDVYNGKEELDEGETAELRFIRIQAAYELLIDPEERRNFDLNNIENPMKASRAWAEWVMKKRKAYEQRGDMAVSAWANEQQRNMNLKARALSRAKIDPEEERRLLAKERQANFQMFETTLKRHSLVLRKRDIMRKKAEETSKQRLVRDLLLSEGFELDES